jgi:site-specific DNA recombinase
MASWTRCAVLEGERANSEAERKSQAVSAGMRRRAEKGKTAGGIRPYGYRWEGPRLAKSLVVVVPAEAQVVVRMFEDSCNGVSQRALARALIAEGIDTVQGKPWGQAAVGRILMNPLNKGVIRHVGKEYPGIDESIVSEEP